MRLGLWLVSMVLAGALRLARVGKTRALPDKSVMAALVRAVMRLAALTLTLSKRFPSLTVVDMSALLRQAQDIVDKLPAK